MYKDLEFLVGLLYTTDRLESKTIENWIHAIANELNLSASRVNRIMGSCRNFFSYLKSIKVIPATTPDPFITPIEFRKSNKKNSRAAYKTDPWLPFEDDDVVTLHEAARTGGDEQLADLIVLAAYTGARIEELCKLQCDDIDRSRKVIKIVDAKTEAGRRTVPIHPELESLINDLMSTTTDNYLLTGLTLNKYGHRSNAIGKRFGRLKKKLKFGKRHVFHSIRKTFTTALENAGVSENIAADIVGHEKPRITYGLYSGGASTEVKREAIGKISYAFKARRV